MKVQLLKMSRLFIRIAVVTGLSGLVVLHGVVLIVSVRAR
jgi:hypothetical protein